METKENFREELDEPVGIKLNSKDWHYKLMQWFWRSLAPNKYNMFNLCPYFWMLGATLFLLPFYVPLRFLFWVTITILEYIDMVIVDPIMDVSAAKWYENLTGKEVYSMYNTWNVSAHRKKYMHKILGAEFKFNEYKMNNALVEKWFKNNISDKKQRDHEGTWQTSDDFIAWKREMLEAMEMSDDEKQARKDRFEKTLEKFRENVNNTADLLKYRVLSFTEIIKWTRRVVGALITLVLAGLSFVIIALTSKGILTLVSVTTLTQLLYISMITGIGVVTAAIIIEVVRLVEISTKEGWKEFWWAQVFMYTLGYPIMYLGYMPLKIVFYYFVYELIGKNLFYGIKGAGIGLWNGFVEFGGIFGAYFGATKGDYCPGIEWDTDETEIDTLPSE